MTAFRHTRLRNPIDVTLPSARSALWRIAFSLFRSESLMNLLADPMFAAQNDSSRSRERWESYKLTSWIAMIEWEGIHARAPKPLVKIFSDGKKWTSNGSSRRPISASSLRVPPFMGKGSVPRYREMSPDITYIGPDEDRVR